MKRSVLFLSLTLLGLASCRKDTPLKDQAPQSPEAPGANLRTINLPNPFEELGVMHNKTLDFVASQPGFPNLTLIQTYNAVYDFLHIQYPTAKLSDTEVLSFRSQVNLLVSAGANAPAMLLQSNKITVKGKVLLDELYGILFSNNTHSNPVGPQSMNDKIADFEIRLCKQFGRPSANLNSNTENALILAGAALARHSYAYWYNAFNNVNNPWHVVFHADDSPDHRPFPMWLRAVCADIGGFFDNDCTANGYTSLNCAVAAGADASAKI